MIGAILIAAFAAAIVVTYLIIVNRMLRADENWNETTAVKPEPLREAVARSASPTVLAHA